jgi:hypothetical protein
MERQRRRPAGVGSGRVTGGIEGAGRRIAWVYDPIERRREGPRQIGRDGVMRNGPGRTRSRHGDGHRRQARMGDLAPRAARAPRSLRAGSAARGRGPRTRRKRQCGEQHQAEQPAHQRAAQPRPGTLNVEVRSHHRESVTHPLVKTRSRPMWLPAFWRSFFRSRALRRSASSQPWSGQAGVTRSRGLRWASHDVSTIGALEGQDQPRSYRPGPTTPSGARHRPRERVTSACPLHGRGRYPRFLPH